MYHSAYDTIKWYQTYSDTDLQLRPHAVAADRHAGAASRRRAGAAVPVHRHRRHADALRGELEKLAETKKDSKVDMKPVRAAVEALGRAASGFREGLLPASDERASAAHRRARGAAAAEQAAAQSEQKLGNSDGLPRRDWFKHQIYAPGFYTGYGVKTMPQIREGLEEGRFTRRRAACARCPRRSTRWPRR